MRLTNPLRWVMMWPTHSFNKYLRAQLPGIKLCPGRWISGQDSVRKKSLSHVRLFATPWTVAYQAPPSMGFSRQEYWNGLPLPSLNCPCRWNKISPTKVSSKWIVVLNGEVRKPGRRHRGISSWSQVGRNRHKSTLFMLHLQCRCPVLTEGT